MQTQFVMQIHPHPLRRVVHHMTRTRYRTQAPLHRDPQVGVDDAIARLRATPEVVVKCGIADPAMLTVLWPVCPLAPYRTVPRETAAAT